MRPLALSMEGFGPFRRPTDVDFTDAELLAFVGPTGSGKSTIIDAITFALYGSVARYDDNRAVAPVINQTSTQAKVRLDFEVAGRQYRAVRVVRRTKQGATTPEARLERGDEVLAADARAVTEAVSALLGLDAAQFNKTVVLPQGRFAEFLHDKPANRQATLRGLLDLGLYERMGREARQRAATAKAQADGFADDVATLQQELTDERHRQLTAAVGALDAARRRVDEGAAELARLSDEAGRRDEELAVLDRTLELLGTVTPPPDLEELVADERAAACELEAATARLAHAREGRARALADALAGPDPVEVQLQLHAHVRHREARDALARAETALTAVRQRADAADTAARQVRERLTELERAVAAAQEAERESLEQVGDGSDESATRDLLALHDRYHQARREITALDEAAGATTAAAQSALATVQAAEDEERRVRGVFELAQTRAGAAGLAATLRVGEHCPVCQQPVHELPEVPPDEELDVLRRARDEATHALTEARGRADAAGRAAAAATAEQQLGHRSLAELAAALQGRPARDEAARTLEAIERARAMLAAARTRAVEAAAALDGARRDPRSVAALDAAEAAAKEMLGAEAAVSEQQRQLKEAVAGLAHVPGEAEVHAAIADAERLAKQRQQAEDELIRAERDHADAQARVQAVAERLTNARTALENARDRVAVLDPPMIDRNDVAGAWRELMGWVSTEQQATAERRRAADSARAAVRAAHGQLERELRAAVTGLVPDEHRPIGALREALTQARAEAAAAVGRFEAERARLDNLRARVGVLREDAAVADSLGRLLSATGFEAWLMAAALDELCARATTRLHALSGGRYSLVLADREFLVRDHHNADELRNVRTLSGGETFLASLALALALAEATAELAPAGAPTIESIFLDEGFGTLDADTLDTVAAAIEDLGASGRMVAIVTHIRELAERMPVRLEVATSAGGSTVTRIDV